MVNVPKQISILGSTGSVGRNTLDVVRSLKGRVRVFGLSANTREADLVRQIEEFKPIAAAAGEKPSAELQSACLRCGTELVCGREGLARVATLPEADLVVNALLGAAGIEPTLAAIYAGKDVAIANKESLVAAGKLILEEAEEVGVNLIPVDSEHSAIYQCLRGENAKAVRRIILTASGGSLIDMDPETLQNVTAEEALSHPTWKMGRKVTIDSATLLNKGFEVIEARWLFGIEAERIEVVIERKSIVHSLVEFVDGSVSAVLSAPDMRLPIQYALTSPERMETAFSRLDLGAIGGLTFEEPDRDKFPCLALAYEALRLDGTAPAVLSAADEITVAAFLAGRIKFGDIHPILRDVLAKHAPAPADDLETILDADRWARAAAEGAIARRVR